MLKKISLIITIFLSFIFLNNITHAECEYQGNSETSWNTSSNLMGCLENGETKLAQPDFDGLVESGFKTRIKSWITKIAGFLGLAAVGALVYSGFMMTISGGEEEKIKKAKDIAKWAILGFLGVVTASSIIAIIVNFMYSF